MLWAGIGLRWLLCITRDALFRNAAAWPGVCRGLGTVPAAEMVRRLLPVLRASHVGSARKYTSVDFTLACPSHKETLRTS